MKSPKLPLSINERQTLKKRKIRLGAISLLTPEELAGASGFSPERSEHLVALAKFQTLVSVGPAFARNLWSLGIRSLEDIKDRNPVEMYNQLSQQMGAKLDPCVEDVLRSAVGQMKFPDLPEEEKDWWRWMDQRGSGVVKRPR